MNKQKYDQLLTSGTHRVNDYIKYTVASRKEFLEKNKEYGQTWLCYRIKSLVTRIWNKGLRIRSIQDKGAQLVGDTIETEFKAFYNYSLIALIVIDRLVSEKLDLVNQLELESEDSIEEPLKKASDACFELFKKKDHDYNGAWVSMSISSIVDEVMVKLKRTIPLLKTKNDIPLEEFKKKISEIFMDVANYGVFGSILIEEVGVNPME